MKENAIAGWSQDQHLFNQRLGIRPLNALRTFFPDDEYTGMMDMLYYGGDLFDFFLDAPATDERIEAVMNYMGWRLEQSVKHGYGVRVLKGTPYHDREQNQMWNTVNGILGNKADFKYVDTLSIEIHPVMGSILYIPDEWKPTPDETWSDVVEIMRVHSLTQVDWIIMHGAFKFQIPEHLHSKIECLHDEKRYSAICRKYCLVGHVHNKGQWKNIISIGSLDRKAFGEEEPKGVLRIECSPNGDNLTFIENTLARVMPTINVVGRPFNDVIKEINNIVENNDPEYLSIRLLGTKLDEVYLNMDAIIKRFEPAEIVFKDQDAKAKKNPLSKLNQIDLKDDKVDLSAKSVQKMLKDRIGDQLTETIEDKIQILFKDYK